MSFELHLTNFCTIVNAAQEAIELDMEQWTGSKLGREYVKAAYCHPAYLTYIQSTSGEMPVGCSISWNQDCREK